MRSEKFRYNSSTALRSLSDHCGLSQAGDMDRNRGAIPSATPHSSLLIPNYLLTSSSTNLLACSALSEVVFSRVICTEGFFSATNFPMAV